MSLQKRLTSRSSASRASCSSSFSAIYLEHVKKKCKCKLYMTKKISREKIHFRESHPVDFYFLILLITFFRSNSGLLSGFGVLDAYLYFFLFSLAHITRLTLCMSLFLFLLSLFFLWIATHKTRGRVSYMCDCCCCCFATTTRNQGFK